MLRLTTLLALATAFAASVLAQTPSIDELPTCAVRALNPIPIPFRLPFRRGGGGLMQTTRTGVVVPLPCAKPPSSNKGPG